MKKVFIVFLAAAGIMACKGNDKKASVTETIKDSVTAQTTPGQELPDTASNTTIQWLDSTYLDLGKQKEGKEIELTFRFRNTGSKNLVIQNVSAQCGCTIPEKPEKPFAPGEEGVIKAKYNGSGHGETRKEVYVTANTSPNAHTLTFRAELVK
ncbi:MAG: DUF1573 domain-containing protein [Ferruginibacter sp.]|nr:DUF1573 domain-containing protein [Chitinophagaceae bacterium]